MCLIIAAPHKKRIPDAWLDAAASTNRDGAGVAWFDSAKKKICFKKHLDLPGVKSVLDNEASGKSYAVHFRIATVGGVDPALTHPFTIEQTPSIEAEGEADSLLFQNGTCSDWRDMLLKSSLGSGVKIPPPPWSDSRAIAFLCSVHGKHILSILGDHSRYLVFDAAESASQRMMLWGDWHDYEGFRFSNKNSPVFTAPVVANKVAAAYTTPTTGDTNQTRTTHTSGTTAGTATKRYVPKAGYNAFSVFTDTGLPKLIATNEPPLLLQ
jgi:hypothetical protein